MKENQISKYIPIGMIGIQATYFTVLLIAVLVKAYWFSDLSFTLIYLLAIILLSIASSFKYIEKCKIKSIELKDRLVVFLLLLLPSTLFFVFCMYVVINVKYIFD